MRHGLVIGSTLTLARALGGVRRRAGRRGAIAGRTATATTFVHTAVEERQEPAAFGMALLLAAAAVALLFVLSRRRSP